ncbi:MAG TPA: DUF6421 family protein [Solirubrobacteraceae bacterium]|jgi:hypothetical protein
MPQHRPTARVLFDEAHSEAWTLRPDVAAAMQPAHPQDSSYALAAAALAARDFAVDAHVQGPLDAPALAAADVLVIAHPSEPRFERTVPGGEPRLSAEELDAIERHVAEGGGLIVLGETEQEKYGNNLNELLGRFGLSIEHDTVQDYERHLHAPSWILADLPDGGRGLETDLLARVRAACFYRASTVAAADGARVLARTSPSASTPGAPLVAATTHGRGRVVALSDSDLFGDDCLGDLDHEALWVNLVYWAAGPAFATHLEPVVSAAHADPAWAVLRDEADALALLQASDGALRDAADAEAAGRHVEAMRGAITALRGHFPHQAAYVDALLADLAAWAAGGFARPDFTASLEVFRPELERRDGIEHLVVFPMYKQNGSRDTCFEALIVRVPWPEWLAELEATRYDNPKFVPVELVDHTRGYDSECAVLFPETVAVAGRPVNNFGGIFCDREAERFRRVVSHAADLLQLNLPPDAAALLASETLSRDAYELWDLVHDRAHSHGDLPFDPFMIRQRAPYWMYSLEELRCDLTAFGESLALEREGFAFARHVQYAVLFDRLFRFPVTGERVRNYDGLGGQLLFAYLHRHGFLHWTDNRLTIEWDRIADGVVALREAVEELYRSGIDRSKLAHWCAAHDLVATYVAPATGSRWAREKRDFTDVEDPRPYIDLVLADEFPLSIFYSSLRAKLAPVLRREPVAA